MQFTALLVFSLLGSWLALAPRSAARAKETGFLDRAISVGGPSYRYQVFLPEKWCPKQKWPIILNSWDKAYFEPDLMPWLLSQSL